MAIRTSVKTKFALRAIIMIVVCLVLGLWGVYDYAIAIPNQQRAYDRGQICLAVLQALQSTPGSTDTPQRIAEARAKVDEQIAALVSRGIEEAGPNPSQDDVRSAVERIATDDGSGWTAALGAFAAALTEAEQARSAAEERSPRFVAAYQAAEAGVNATAEISPPSQFDRLTQWAFILCLPFVPYMAWQLFGQKRRVVELDDDGTLRADGQEWTDKDISGIDMSRWMARSVAFVVHRDGRRIKLDDYVWSHTDEIVGRIASAREPEAWTTEARPVKPETPADDGDTEPDDDAPPAA